MKLVEVLKSIPDLLTGHKVIVSRSVLGKAWRDEVNPKPCIADKIHDASGACYDSAFNDMCKRIGLAEGK